MKKFAIRKGLVIEDKRTGRKGMVVSLNSQHGWTVLWERGGPTASRHLKESVIWKFYRLVNENGTTP